MGAKQQTGQQPTSATPNNMFNNSTPFGTKKDEATGQTTGIGATSFMSNAQAAQQASTQSASTTQPTNTPSGITFPSTTASSGSGNNPMFNNQVKPAGTSTGSTNLMFNNNSTATSGNTGLTNPMFNNQTTTSGAKPQ